MPSADDSCKLMRAPKKLRGKMPPRGVVEELLWLRWAEPRSGHGVVGAKQAVVSELSNKSWLSGAKFGFVEVPIRKRPGLKRPSKQPERAGWLC